ncbi:oxalate decarboxylase [Lactarius quietus]|nr:oxalate decarboxylase [Lactarius quietus]
MSYWKSVALAACLATVAFVFGSSESTTVVPASDDPNYPIFPPGSDVSAQPIRGALGGTILGPQNLPLQQENPDLLAPLLRTMGAPNAKWSFTLSSNRLQTGGWARQQNVDSMPIATSIAGVNMRLEPGATRELHWHSAAEWTYVIKGAIQITSVDQDGRNYVATINAGDLWYFPAGIPHSLQDTGTSPADLSFCWYITDWLAHVPKEVIAKSFQADITAFDHIPSQELYIFPSEPPTTDVAPSSPQGQIPVPFSFAWSQVNATKYPGGSVKIVDSTTFKISKSIAAAEVTVEPGAIRELHDGYGRVTIFASSSNARTFDYQAGDIGFVPATFGHYVENIGNTTLRFLEIANTDRFQDISLTQWLALTPPQLVKANLGLSDETIPLK